VAETFTRDTGLVRVAYDPRHDPLIASSPGHGQDYAPTYWIATGGPRPADDGPIGRDVDVDVAIIGSGYTGLACAIFLAREHGIKATVLEANQAAWGCSSRNGGQALNSSGRLSRSQWIARWGLDVARRMHREIAEGFATFKQLIADGRIECDQQPGGHLFIAHKPAAFARLAAEAKILREQFGYVCEILSADELRRRYVDEADTVGAMHEPEGIGVHPVKLAYGYLRMARRLGVTVHPGSPVLGWEEKSGVYHLRTPGGTVRARAVAVATGGYGTPGLHSLMRGRILPVLSNSIVTRPLTPEEKRACNFLTTQIITDTRLLRYYYRLLPDDRLQLGSRCAITGADAENPRHLRLLVEGLHRKFPPLTGIDIDYHWWGWVDVSHDMMPRVVQPDPGQRIFYALGYGGNGVMYSAQAGRRMAGQIAGKGTQPELPIFASPLPSHPLAPFRRLGQRLLYKYYYLRDEVL
jgi:glycine/D-amino acid oxidase-like deaminating enzyme